MSISVTSRYILTLTIILFYCVTGYSQNANSELYNKIRTEHNKETAFNSVSLFINEGLISNSFIKQGRIYDPITANIKQLYIGKPQAISLDIQAPSGKIYTLELVRSYPLSANAVIEYMDAAGKHNTNHTGLHYNGIIKGELKSIAAISVFDNGEIMGLFSCNDGNFNLGKLEDYSGKFILYNSNDRLEELKFNCATPDTGIIDIDYRSARKTTGAILCNKLRVHWEVDYTFYQSKGTLQATQNYLSGIFNFMHSIYYNDGIAVEMSSMKIWTIDDPITTTNAYDASWQFGRYWQTLKHTYYGEQPHHIANFAGWQGYANIGGICFPSGYACSNLLGQQSATYPVFDVDVYVVSHETGHTIGSQHTQSCSWMTGPGGTCGSVDNCVAQEGGGGCSTCYYLNDANASGFKGTIMSYCGGKINFSEGFGPTVSNFLRAQINQYTCLSNVISPELAHQNICNSDGAVTVNYQNNNFGVAPYKYLWSNNQQTKDINGLTTAGTYYLSITDSNNCTTSDSAVVAHFPKPGDGIALAGTMPYCCKDTSFNVTINSTLPTNITNCQTVAWLRTLQPIATYNDALTAYMNAGSDDIIMSDNSALVDNSTSAKLTIPSPATCDSVSAYYYTPFVSLRPLQKAVYTTNAINKVDIKNGNSLLGKAMTIPSEPNYPSTCQMQNPSVNDTITVTISNYTGRTNKLSIRVIGDNKTELYHRIDLAGNGTYNIPITGTVRHFQEMTVQAYDFNCSGGNTCTASSLDIQAVRTVTYDTLSPLSFDSSCVAGTSVYLSFGPDNCLLNAIDPTTYLNYASLYPNPARNEVTLEFHPAENVSCSIKIQTITGAVMHTEIANYQKGNFKKTFNTSNYPPGIYIIKLSDDRGYNGTQKLVIY